MLITWDHGCYRWIFNVLPKVHILSDVSLAGAHCRRAFNVMRCLGLWLYSFFASSTHSSIHFSHSFVHSLHSLLSFFPLFFILSLLHPLINSLHPFTLFICFLHLFILHSFFASQPPSGNPICLDSYCDMFPCQTHSSQNQTEVSEAVSLTNLSDL